MDLSPHDVWEKAFVFSAKSAKLWRKKDDTRTTTLDVDKLFPILKISPQILIELWKKSRGYGFLVGHRSSDKNFLETWIEEIHWNPEETPRGDTVILLKPDARINIIDLENTYNRILLKMNHDLTTSIHTNRVPLPSDFFKPIMAYTVNRNALYLNCTLLYPQVRFEFSRVDPIKIVATQLSRELSQGRLNEDFHTGFLTMDQQKRVLVVNSVDQMAKKYPLIGIWVTGLTSSSSTDQGRTRIFGSPLVWSAWLRFIENSTFTTKITNSSERRTFLLINFSNQTHFYQFGHREGAWKTLNKVKKITTNDNIKDFYINFKENDDSHLSFTKEETLETGRFHRSTAEIDSQDRLSTSTSSNQVNTRRQNSLATMDPNHPLLASSTKQRSEVISQPEADIETFFQSMDETKSRRKRRMQDPPLQQSELYSPYDEHKSNRRWNTEIPAEYRSDFDPYAEMKKARSRRQETVAEFPSAIFGGSQNRSPPEFASAVFSSQQTRNSPPEQPSAVFSSPRSPELSELTDLFASNYSHNPSISSSEMQTTVNSINTARESHNSLFTNNTDTIIREQAQQLKQLEERITFLQDYVIQMESPKNFTANNTTQVSQLSSQISQIRSQGPSPSPKLIDRQKPSDREKIKIPRIIYEPISSDEEIASHNYK